MKIPLHIKLLEELKEAGIGVMVDVSPFIKVHFDRPNNSDSFKDRIRPAILFLRDLVKMDFICLEQKDNYLDVVIESGFPANRQFDDIEIKVYITSKGLDYLDNYENNKRSKNLYTVTVINIIIAIILSFFMAWVGWANLRVAKATLNTPKRPDSVPLRTHK